VMVLHPLSDPADHSSHSPAHCDHTQSLPIAHLFCRGWTIGFSDAGLPCPHTGDAGTL
jgi:hypothetical protein